MSDWIKRIDWPVECVELQRKYDALQAERNALRAALEDAIELAEADLFAVGHMYHGEARTTAMACYREAIARWSPALRSKDHA